jgi:hypothetical protein
MKALLLTLLVSTAYADSFTLGVGKTLNNYTASAPGYLIDATYRYESSIGPVQFSVTQIEKDKIAQSTLNVSAILLHQWDAFSAGGGIVLGQSYEVPQWWVDHQGKQAWGIKAECTLCGLVLQAGYRATDRLEIQMRYLQTQKYLIPSQNGVLIVMTYRML